MIVINKKNFVKDMLSSLELQTTIEIMFFILGILLIVFGVFDLEKSGYLFYFIGFIIFVISGYLFQDKITTAKIWRAGLKGQERVEEILSVLPDDYVLINNLSLPFKNCDIDHLLIGPNGIFLLETKHYKGEISCVVDAWEYQKIGKNGGLYKGYINNPSRQLKRNIWELKTFFDKKSKRIFGIVPFPYWIQGIVVFTNDEAELSIKEETVLILKISQLLEYVQSKRDYKIPKEDLQKIVQTLIDL
ncbi:NERD domain-containing protein [bacterium]|nr:NERD domain-containing protein [bacterium]